MTCKQLAATKMEAKWMCVDSKAGLLQAGKQHNLPLVCSFYSRIIMAGRCPMQHGHSCFARCIMSNVHKLYLLIVVWDK